MGPTGTMDKTEGGANLSNDGNQFFLLVVLDFEQLLSIIHSLLEITSSSKFHNNVG